MPIFHTDKDRSFLMIDFPIHPSFFEKGVKRSSERSLETGSERGSEKNVDKMIKIIKENLEISAQQIATRLGLSARAIEKHLSNLKNKSILKRVGPDYGGHWEISNST